MPSFQGGHEGSNPSGVASLRRSLSSVGRAPPLQGGCQWFESTSDHHFYFPLLFGAVVVQLVRMPPCHGGGRGFESRPPRHFFFSIFSKIQTIAPQNIVEPASLDVCGFTSFRPHRRAGLQTQSSLRLLHAPPVRVPSTAPLLFQYAHSTRNCNSFSTPQ